MSEETKKAPVIRFKGFFDDWEQRKLGDDKDVRDGTHDSPKYHKEGHPLVTSKNLNDYGLDMTDVSLISDADFEAINKRSKVDNGDILFGMIGTIGNPVIVDRSDFAIKNVALIKEGGDIPNRFLIQLLKSSVFEKYIRNENAGNTQKFLGLSKIREFIFFAPTTEEQIRIATFFKQLDDTIALHQRKLTLLEQLKQTYLQQMFPQDENNFPVLRIAGFSQPWVLRRLSDVSERVRGNDGRMDLPTLTISAGSGWLDQRERFSGNIAGNEQKNYTLLSNGELSYNHGNSKLAKYGVVFALRTFEEALVPKVYHSFKTTDEASADFVEYMFATKRPDRELAKLVSSGARMDGLLNINYDEFMGIDIMVPEIDEQNRISHFLRNFDDTILLHRCKIEKLTELKKVLLAKMFL